MPQRLSLDDLRVASPCHASWDAMRGDDRVRFCALCAKHVYNLSAMTSAEALRLVETTEGRICGRFHRRRDGKVLTADCPVGLRAAVRRRLLRLATAAVFFASTVRAGLWVYVARSERVDGYESGAIATLKEWVDRAALAVGLPPVFGRGYVMGAICAPARSQNEGVSADEY
jgi:hypothetical protein